MEPSKTGEVRAMYDATAESYAEMMKSEINLPIYSDSLGRIQARIANTAGTFIDTSCGSGHMLSMYHARCDQNRSLLGIDLSPRMVCIAGERLGSSAEIVIGDMRDLSTVETGSAAAVLSFFAIHHLDPEGVGKALAEWHRVLGLGGQLLIAAWEGTGAIDYGDAYDIIALRYRADELASFVGEVGFTVASCIVEPVTEIPMDAIYLEAAKE